MDKDQRLELLIQIIRDHRLIDHINPDLNNVSYGDQWIVASIVENISMYPASYAVMESGAKARLFGNSEGLKE